MMISDKVLRRSGMAEGERWSCRAFCQSCEAGVWRVEKVPESSKSEVERLILWMRRNIGHAHQARTGCSRLRLRWTWTLLVPARKEARATA